MFHSKISDKDMAKKLNVTEATMRRQRFTFREKAKQAKFYLAMYELVFEDGKKYSEQEVNEILRPIYEDYMTIRRYLIMYGFMERTKDGRQYWLTN